MKNQMFRFLCITAVLLSIAGCARRNASSVIERHHQFSMAIGKMEDQIDLIQLPGKPFSQTIDLEMKNGLFYISNGAAKKVMEFSSYGDLITLYYNHEANPQPVLLAEKEDAEEVVNRKAYRYPFNEVGEIAVADSGLLYIQDVVAKDRRMWDEELKTQLRNVVLRFGPDGKLFDYIGQEGVSGTPFPFIDSISLGQGGVLTVVARTTVDWIVFSYNRFGELRHRYSFTNADIPVPEEGVIASIARVMPASQPDILYVKTDYYRNESMGSDVGFSKSAIHSIDTSAGVVTISIDLPPAYKTSGKAQMFTREKEEVIQHLAGASEDGVFFLLSGAGEALYNLMLVDTSGMVVHQGLIELNDSETVFRKFFVTPEGILTALIGGNTEADVVLWRTDGLISGEI